jgi:hypothetical protein
MQKKVLIGVGLVVLAAAGTIISLNQPSLERASKAQDAASSLESDTAASASRAQGDQATGEQTADFKDSAISLDDQTTAVASEGQMVAWKQEELSAAVLALLGLDGKKHNYPELMQAISALGKEIAPADVAALRDMLNFPNDRFPEKMRPIEINGIKNDVLDRLLRQPQLAEGLGLQLAEMAADSENDSVWRDYSIQFMGQYYERFSTEDGGQTSEDGDQVDALVESDVIRESLFAALDERDDTLAGTSLIGLELLSRTNDEFDRELIVEKTVEIASDETASSHSRLTALRLAAMTEGSESTAEIARSLAQTGETILLRSAAIVTLGETGTADDQELLESFTFAENKQIAAAATLALQKLEATQP